MSTPQSTPRLTPLARIGQCETIGTKGNISIGVTKTKRTTRYWRIYPEMEGTDGRMCALIAKLRVKGSIGYYDAKRILDSEGAQRLIPQDA